MTSDRSYRRALSPVAASRRIAMDAGRQFDPLVAAALIELICADL
jgi:HD-GYP domain-containing protein (c-di-GMP phosphodiesterase class II)